MPSIEVSGLTKRFGETTAVAGISFSVPQGSFTTLLGPSGCGKSTTLRMLAGLERPDGGEIKIADRVVSSAKAGTFVPVEDRNVGVVFQSYALWPHMNVYDHVAYPLRVRSRPSSEVHQRVAAALDLVQLSHHAKRYPSEISGGQQQRVALARALVFNPAVLLLDEPLSNLDAALRGEMRAELARLHHETGMTTVYVTHDQSEALALSDQILLMRHGEVVERGAPESIYEQPSTQYGAQFVGAANCLSASVVEVAGGSATLALGSGDRLRTPAAWLEPSDVGSRVVVVVRPEDVVVIQSREVYAENVVSGALVQSTYLGSHYELVLTIGGDTVKVHAPKTVGRANDRTISLYVAPDAMRVLAPRGAERATVARAADALKPAMAG